MEVDRRHRQVRQQQVEESGCGNIPDFYAAALAGLLRTWFAGLWAAKFTSLVSKNNCPGVVDFAEETPAKDTEPDHQEEHHRTRTFQAEFRAFLRKYGGAYDEA